MSDKKSKIGKTIKIIVNAPLSVYGIMMFVFSLVMYIIMENDGDISKTKNLLLVYAITQLVCIILNLSATCISLIDLYCSHKYVRAILTLGYIIANTIMIVSGIVNIVYAIFITYEFFAYNCNPSYAYFVPMLIFVILLLIPFVLIMIAFVIVVLVICVVVCMCLCVCINTQLINRALEDTNFGDFGAGV